jgi:hypothetical protein
MILIKSLPINMSFKITYEVIISIFFYKKKKKIKDFLYKILNFKKKKKKNSTFIIEVIIKVY